MSIRLGVIGCSSHILHSIVRPAISVRGVQLTALAGRTPRSADDFIAARGLGGVRGYASGEELIEAPDLDAVYVAVPTHLHAHYAVAAARAGKHVLVEKPLGMNSGECVAIGDAASKAGVVALEGLMVQHHPWGDMIRSLAVERTYGAIVGLRTRLCCRINEERLNRMRSVGQGGGVLRDMAPYWLHFVDVMAGLNVGDVSGEVRMHGQCDFDEEASARLVLGGEGVIAHFFASYRPARYEALHEVVFEGATVAVKDVFRPNLGPCRLEIVTRTSEGEIAHQLFEPQHYFTCQLRAFIALPGAPGSEQRRYLGASLRRQTVVDRLLEHVLSAPLG